MLVVVKIYNTESAKKEEFVPQNPEHVTMYVCGPTVYNHSHIGNFRPPVVFDVLARLLRREYPKLTYARNITDIDDKINAAAAEAGVDISVISEKYTAAYHQDLETLGVLPTDLEPKVTEHVSEIHHMIQDLIDSEHAYEAQGHVLFAVDSYASYGGLSKRNPDELLAGARVDVAAYKRNAGDFVLWKPSRDDQPGWDSPWGRGRPGWHIECSAMAATHLGDTIDIHGGGADLVFPHHENEQAQSVCAHGGKQYVRYWMHNGFLSFNSEKMSKSLGNVLLVKDLVEHVPGEAIRYVLLSAHYRAPLDWNDDVLTQAKNSLDRLYGSLRTLTEIDVANEMASDMHGEHVPAAFLEALHDDLNTPKALAELFALSKQVNTTQEPGQLKQLKLALLQAGKLLGLLQQDPDAWFAGNASDDDSAMVEQLIAERLSARAEKNWARADQIRDQLTAMGVTLEDGGDGTKWRKGNGS